MSAQILNKVVISLGSNIEPQQNICQAIQAIQKQCKVKRVSSAWETRSEGAKGPNFFNAALLLETPLHLGELKRTILKPIENEMARVRTADKNAPRTIDLDIIVFNGDVVDQNVWERVFVAVPLAEILPELVHPETKETLSEVALRLKKRSFAIRRPDICLPK
ncbi:MAG TPA: 2-amino-4-hydroxy-6-hydroxymethyldihydropteridine diphosphokinase [Longilinea sp.]|nr:2-amino-4-hydroxy-6-hydroxymethyldihydropteridine diphosphokinase [Longilinea sp.]